VSSLREKNTSWGGLYSVATVAAPQTVTGAADMADIRDIKPPLLPAFDPTTLYWALGLILLALALAAAWYLWRRRQRRKQATAAPLKPHEAATRDLEALNSDLDCPGREFYFRLSTIFRGYVENAFDIKALEMTTEELLPKLASLPVPAELHAEAKGFLRNADPVKFAGREVDRKAMSKDFSLVRTFVEATKPPESPVNSPGKPNV